MEKWWNESFFNRRNWILENYQDINVSPSEAVVLLMIDFLNENNRDFTLNSLSEKIHLSEKETDDVISALVTKGYLKITSDGKKVSFVIDGVFDKPKEQVELGSIFDIFEEEFGRVLSQAELREINAWLGTYKQEDVIYALRQASIYNKKNFSYIRSILRDKGKK